MLLAVSISILYSGCNDATPEPVMCEPVVRVQKVIVPVQCKHEKVVCGKLHGALDDQLGQTIECVVKYKVELTRCK